MRYGRLDRRIILQRRSSELTASGDPVNAWSNIATRWASVGPVRGTEQFAIPQITAKELVEIGIRHSAQTADLHPGDRVVFPSSADPAATPIAVYDILAVHELGRREGQRIIAERQPVPAAEPLIDPLVTNPFTFWLPRPPFLFQDLAGLMPVFEDGQSVRRVNGLGPHGFILTAPSDPARPIYRTDGVAHWLQSLSGETRIFNDWTANPVVPQAQPIVRISGWRIAAATTQFERDFIGNAYFGAPENQQGLFALLSGDNPPNTLSMFSGPGFTSVSVSDGIAIENRDFVATEILNGAGSSLSIDNTTATGSTGPNGINGETIFERRADHANSMLGRWYGHVTWVGFIPSGAVIASTRRYIASLQPNGPML